MTKHWWHPDRLPQIQQSKKRPLDGAKNAERSWHEQDPADLRRPLVVSDFGVADAAPAHPRQLGFGGRSQRPDVGHRNHQRRRRCRRHLSKAEFRRGCLSRRRFHPKEPVRLHIETGGSMAGCIEDLFTQYLWDFDWLKGLNCSPMEERIQGFAHGYTSMLLLQHIRVANATYKRNAGATIGSILRYSENDSGPEVGFWETRREVFKLHSYPEAR